jgi:hypothetical protein
MYTSHVYAWLRIKEGYDELHDTKTCFNPSLSTLNLLFFNCRISLIFVILSLIIDPLDTNLLE